MEKKRRDQQRKESSKVEINEEERVEVQGGKVVMLRKADSSPTTCVFSSIAQSDGGSFIYTVPVH